MAIAQPFKAGRWCVGAPESREGRKNLSRVQHWMLDVFRFTPKKYRPPRPMGVKGGCSPQNIFQNLRC